MFQVHDEFTLNVKRNERTIKNAFVLFGGASLLLSAAYGLYWGLASNGDIVIEYTQQYFSPLVNVFFDDINNLNNYLIMSLYLFAFTIPCCVAHYITEKISETLIAINQKRKEHQKRKERIQREIEKEQEFTRIDSYTICLSLDFSKNKNLSPTFDKKLNAYLVKSLKKTFSKNKQDAEVSLSKNVIITHSKDFYSYDSVYSTVLKELANTKNLLGDNIEFTPTITTDAYTGEYNPKKSIRQHYDIVKCNLQGRSTSTATFNKKYSHLKQNRFQGTPIGLYTTFENQNYKEYDLNVIHKNLNATISTIK